MHAAILQRQAEAVAEGGEVGAVQGGVAEVTVEGADVFTARRAVVWLLRTTEVRLACARWQVASVHRDGPDLIFTYKDRKKADHLAAGSGGRLKVVDAKNLYMRLQPEEEPPEAMYALLLSKLTII